MQVSSHSTRRLFYVKLKKTKNKGEIMYPKAYIEYLVHFHADRDYFECHEVLEEYWKEDERSNRKKHWIAFIQVAVSLYHQRRGNFSGALKMMKNALSIFKGEKNVVKMLGLDYGILLKIIENRVSEIEHKVPYSSINLPIIDESLLKKCQDVCGKKGVVWGSNSDLSDHYLINKHTLRDRRDVIEERKLQKLKKSHKLQ
jgi:predicted metal-dependent hydrolase